MKCPRCAKEERKDKYFCSSCGAWLSPKGAALTGTTLQRRFVLGRLLGGGSLWSVYEAKDKVRKGPATVRILHPHLALQQDLVKSFFTTAQARLDPAMPPTLQTLAVDSHQGMPWYAAPYIEGEPLENILRKRTLTPDELLALAEALGACLQEVHTNNVAHADLKPQNILLSKTTAQILDWDAAQLKSVAGLWGNSSAPFMSPEVWEGLTNADPRSDVYSLGMLYFLCIVGRLPFQANSPATWMKRHLSAEPLMMPSHPMVRDGGDQLKHVLMRSMAKQKNARQRTAEILAIEIAAAMKRPSIFSSSSRSSASTAVVTSKTFEDSSGVSSQKHAAMSWPALHRSVATQLPSDTFASGAFYAGSAPSSQLLEATPRRNSEGSGLLGGQSFFAELEASASIREERSGLRNLPMSELAYEMREDKPRPRAKTAIMPLPKPKRDLRWLWVGSLGVVLFGTIWMLQGLAPQNPLEKTLQAGFRNALWGGKWNTSTLVSMRLESDPVGARVTTEDGQEICAKTPCEAQITSDGSSVLLLFSLQNVGQTTLRVTPAQGLDVLARIAKSRFTDNGDGTVLDLQHQKMWSKYDNAGGKRLTFKEAVEGGYALSQEDAAAFCQKASWGGFADWRLPTIDEAELLYRSGRGFSPMRGKVPKTFAGKPLPTEIVGAELGDLAVQIDDSFGLSGFAIWTSSREFLGNQSLGFTSWYSPQSEFFGVRALCVRDL